MRLQRCCCQIPRGARTSAMYGSHHLHCTWLPTHSMSDLAAPLLALLPDDAVAFACFAALMARVRRNFAVDESGIWAQLRALSCALEAADHVLFDALRRLGVADCQFAYRLVVVLAKRDLPTDKARMHASDGFGLL